MKKENINIQKLEQFCKILVKLGITKKNYFCGTKTVKKVMSVCEYLKLYKDINDEKIVIDGCLEWEAVNKDFKIRYDVMQNKISEEDFLNQTVKVSYKVHNSRYFKKIVCLLCKYLAIDFSQAKAICEKGDSFKGVVRYFSKTTNIRQTESQFFTIYKKNIHHQSLLNLLVLSFSNSKFGVELGI